MYICLLKSDRIMKKLVHVILVTLLGVVSAAAQDVVVMKNGEAVKAKVSYVGPDTIIYKLYDEPKGAEYETLKSDVAAIHYESGRVEVMDSGKTSYDALLYGNASVAEGIVPGMKYRELKKIYDFREYVPTLVQYHSPAWSGVASLFIPGLGQMVCGSVGRGFAFLGGAAGCYIVMYSGLISGFAGEGILGQTLLCAAFAGLLAVDIGAIVDAVRVAKVKNMYENDLRRKYSFDMKLYPSVGYVRSPDGLQPAPGMTLAFRF